MAAIFQNADLFKFRRRVYEGKLSTASEAQLTTPEVSEQETGFEKESSDPLYFTSTFCTRPAQPSPALLALIEKCWNA